MSDTANTFSSFSPLYKQAYASKSMATHERPGKEKERFSNLKKKLKKNAKS